MVLSGHDDELNTILAGTLTGLLYKSTSGLRKCGLGGALGLAISAAYCLITSGHKFIEWLVKSASKLGTI